MKKTRFFLLFLAVLLLLGGCTSAEPKSTTASLLSQTAAEAFTQSTAAVPYTETEASLAETQTTASVTQSETSAMQSTQAASTVQTEKTEPVTSAVTCAETTNQQTEKETGAKPFWSIIGGNKNTTEKKDGNDRDTCFVTIRCETVKDHLSSLKKGKEAFIPKSGVILGRTEVEFQNGESAFDVIKKACKDNVCSDNCRYCQKGGIQLEYNFTPAFGTYYVEGIHQLYEKDCGSMSGWMFSVNGEFPTDGSSSYTVKPGDEIAFLYTCDMGDDIGNSY